jgi:hypothetical protein
MECLQKQLRTFPKKDHLIRPGVIGILQSRRGYKDGNGARSDDDDEDAGS